MSADVEGDFSRLHATAQVGASGFNMAKSHPVFSAAHSFILAHKYGNEDPQTYLRNPHLRRLDSREAALASLQKRVEGVKRGYDYYRPSIPGPVPTIPAPTPTVPPMPGSYTYKPGNYSQRMTPPGTPIGTTMP